MATPLSNPPANPIEWTAHSPVTHSRCTVTDRTWYGARRQAMALLGCGPDELTVTAKEAT